MYRPHAWYLWLPPDHSVCWYTTNGLIKFTCKQILVKFLPCCTIHYIICICIIQTPYIYICTCVQCMCLYVDMIGQYSKWVLMCPHGNCVVTHSFTGYTCMRLWFNLIREMSTIVIYRQCTVCTPTCTPTCTPVLLVSVEICYYCVKIFLLI